MQSSVELFCYFMSAETYERYYGYVDVNSPWAWGAEMMLHKVFRFKPIVFSFWNMGHWIAGSQTVTITTTLMMLSTK